MRTGGGGSNADNYHTSSHTTTTGNTTISHGTGGSLGGGFPRTASTPGLGEENPPSGGGNGASGGTVVAQSSGGYGPGTGLGQGMQLYVVPPSVKKLHSHRGDYPPSEPPIYIKEFNHSSPSHPSPKLIIVYYLSFSITYSHVFPTFYLYIIPLITTPLYHYPIRQTTYQRIQLHPYPSHPAPLLILLYITSHLSSPLHHPIIPLGKQRIKEFNYAGLNATPFVALENNAPNAYTNPILQACRHTL